MACKQNLSKLDTHDTKSIAGDIGSMLKACRTPVVGPHQTKERTMTPEQIALVQCSFKSVAPIASKAADLFYARLFEIAPEVRQLFPTDLSGQKVKLMGMLATAINNLHRLDAILPTVRRLGDRHRDYGVSAEHYATVGTALLWTLEQGLGAGFTSEVKAAWSEVYCALAGAMQQGERQAKAAGEALSLAE
jgi:hemoglobin-like flavoprotein